MAGEIGSSLQQVRFKPEATRGTLETTGYKIIDAWTYKDGPKMDTTGSRPAGRKYEAKGARTLNREWSEFSIDSPEMCYNSIIYIMASVYDSLSPAAHGSSSTAKDWAVTPQVADYANSKTYSIERGDSNRAHNYAYGLFKKFSYKHDTKGASCTVDGFAQRLADGTSLTSSPTRIPCLPMSATHFNLYLDTASGSIGSTQLTKFISHEHTFDGVFGPAFFQNRSNPSFASHVDMAPKTTGKIMLEADSNGMAWLPYIRATTPLYFRVEAQGQVIDNLQIVTLGTQSSGNFKLTYKGQQTANIAYNAAASAVQSALLLLSTIPAGTVTVSGSNGGPYSIIFSGSLSQDTTALTADFSALTTPGNASLNSTAQSYDKFVHDMCIEVSAPQDFTDSEGVFATGYEYTVVEDATWGKAQVLTATNLLTAL
jgi:hypothetical protein